MPFALPTDNPHSFRDCRNPDVGCAEQREAHRSRLMRLLASAHPTGSRHKGITGYIPMIVYIRRASERYIVIKIVKLGRR